MSTRPLSADHFEAEVIACPFCAGYELVNLIVPCPGDRSPAACQLACNHCGARGPLASIAVFGDTLAQDLAVDWWNVRQVPGRRAA